MQVPSDPPSNTEHPSTVHGIQHVRILTSSTDLQAVSRQITSLIGDAPVSSTDTEVTWELDSVHEEKSGPKLILGSPESDDDARFVVREGTGIYEVAFRIAAGKPGKNGDTPYGKIVWIPT